MRPSYIVIYLSHALHSVIGKLRISSNQLEMDIGRCAYKPLEEWIWQLCHWGMESEECYDFHWDVLYEIRE